MFTLRCTAVLAAGLVVAMFMQPAVADIDTDLVCHWTFDADLTDSEGSAANNGTAYGNAAITTAAGEWVAGGGALKLDGTGDYVRVSDHAEVDGNGSGGLTLSAFVYLNAIPTTGTNADIFTKAYNDEYRFAVNINADLWCLINDGSGARETPVVTTGLSANTWYHVAMTVDFNAGEARFYVDGSQVGDAQTVTETGIQNHYFGHPLFIGTWDANQANGFFNGYMDDLRIYHRVLSATDVGELADVPEPTPLALLTIAGLVMLRRRT